MKGGREAGEEKEKKRQMERSQESLVKSSSSFGAIKAPSLLPCRAP